MVGHTGADPDPREQTNKRIPYALTLSGGVSLGAYEAGINWAILRYLQKASRIRAPAPGEGNTPEVYDDLLAVTGASAGAINALISALVWCMSPNVDPTIFPDTVADNLLRRVWTGVGLEDLLPKEARGYRSDDGLLTREAFATVIGDLSTLIGIEKDDPDARNLPLPAGFSSEPGKGVFRDGCKIQLGFTVTSEKTSEVRVGEVFAPNQRYFIPLTLKVEKGYAKFYSNALDPGLPGVGRLLLLPGKSGARIAGPSSDSYEISSGSVLNVVLASSAFPIAFGRRKMDYCTPTNTSSAGQTRCPDKHDLTHGVFVDGGVFDNIPLGGTKALAENGEIDPGRRVSYLFINPDNMRAPVDPSPAPAQERLGYGLQHQLQFLGGAVDTARKHELYSELGSGDWTRQLTKLTEDFRALAELPDSSSPPPAKLQAACPKIFGALEANPAESRTASRAMDLAMVHRCLEHSAAEYEHHLQYKRDTNGDPTKSPGAEINLAKERERALKRLLGATGLLKNPSRRVEAFQKRLRRALYDEGGDRRVMLSSRLFPITGQYLFAFGAFFDKPFREFDYYVGVYDALHSIAAYACAIQKRSREFRGESMDGDCHGRLAAVLYEIFGIDGDPKARYVFARLALMEHPDGRNGWSWILSKADDNPVEKQLRPLESVLDSLCHFETRYDPKAHEPPAGRVIPVSEFEQFLLELNARNYVTPETSEHLRRTMKDGRVWWSRPAVLISGRLAALEKDSGSKLKGLSKSIAGAAEWHDSDGKSPIDFVGTNGKFPAYFPHEIGAGVGQRTDARSFYASWEWKTRLLFTELPIFVHLAPIQHLFEPEPAGLMRAGVRYHWESSHDLIWGVGLDVNRRWRANPASGRQKALGVSGFVEWKCIRATLGMRDVGELFWNVTDKFAQGRANNYLDVAFVF